MGKPGGLSDKIYWRQVCKLGVYHAFEKVWEGGKGVYESLCGTHTLTHSGGQSCGRPVAEMRCPWCDQEEMEMRWVGRERAAQQGEDLMAECPKCGDGSNGFTYYVQGCTMEYLGMFGDPKSDECVEIHHNRPRPKTVVCGNCGRRMTRAEAMGEDG